MGEKLLAQRLLLLLRETNGGNSRTAQAALEWATDQRDWLWPQLEGDKAPCWESLPELADAVEPEGGPAALFGPLEAVSRLLDLDAFEASLLGVRWR